MRDRQKNRQRKGGFKERVQFNQTLGTDSVKTEHPIT